MILDSLLRRMYHLYQTVSDPDGGATAAMEKQVLKDRVAIITGASKGLGEGIA